MASLNGVTIKSLNKFVGTEGEAYQGNVYYNGRKLGFWSQDGNGGSDHFDFPINQLKKPLEQYKNYLKESGLSKNHPSGSEDLIDMDEFMIEVFMTEVLSIVGIEKQFKINKRNGYPFTLMIYPINDFLFLTIKMRNSEISKEDLQMLKDRIRRQVVDLNPDHKVFKFVSKVIKDSSDLDLVWGEVSSDEKPIKTETQRKRNTEYVKVDELQGIMQKESIKDSASISSRFDVQNKGNHSIITDKTTGRSCDVPLYALGDVIKALKELIV